MTDHHQRRRSIGERFSSWLVRSYVWGPSRRKVPPAGPVPPEPTVDTEAPLAARVLLVVLAVALPVLVAALLIPFRTALTASTQTLILVLPVVAVSVVAHRVAAVVAAISAALAYDVLLTEPYYSLVVDAAEDIEASVVLAVIGVVVGTFVARELEHRTRSTSRGAEVAVLASVARVAASGGADRLAGAATDGIRTVLHARACEWSPGFHGRVGHVMAADGTFTHWHGAALPAGIVELPVRYDADELGRLLVHTTGDTPVSSEERGTALALADLLAVGLAGSR